MKHILTMKNKFLKPNPGGWGGRTMTIGSYTNVSLLKKYISQLQSSHATNVIVQPWLKNFATNQNPEQRLSFVRQNKKHLFHHGVATTKTGYFKSKIYKLPKKLEKFCIKIGSMMEKKFGPIFYYRCDWTKHNGKMLLNELEFFPGINYEQTEGETKKMFAIIADEIIRVAELKSQ